MRHLLSRDLRTIQKMTEELCALSEEYGFMHWLGMATVYKGRTLVEEAQTADGISQIRQGNMMAQATGAELLQSLNSALLVEALGKAGEVEEGLVILDQSLAHLERTGERFYEAELCRLKGEFLMKQAVSLIRFIYGQVIRPQIWTSLRLNLLGSFWGSCLAQRMKR
jgi:predicted ATPase